MKLNKIKLRRYLNEMKLAQRALERNMQKDMTVLLKKQYTAYLKEAPKISAETIIKHQNQLDDVFSDYVKRTYNVYRHLYLKYIKPTLKKNFDSDIDKLVREYIRDNLGQKITNINDYTVEQVKNIYARVVEQTDADGAEDIDISRTNISKLFKQEIGQFSRSRANIIARTEAQSMMGTVQFKQAEALQDELEEPVYKIWLAGEDDRTREDHIDAQEQGAIPLNQPFLVGSSYLMYPGDPSGPPEQIINCRCKMLEGTMDVLEDFL